MKIKRTMLHNDESGTMTLVNAVVVMFGFLMTVLVLNVGHISHEKVAMQNAADAVAYSGSVWHARGLNAITASNHVIGEMNALVIIHEAVGGELLEQGGTAESASNLRARTVKKGSILKNINRMLEMAKKSAEALDAQTFAFDTVREKNGVHADVTVLEAKAVLKKLLTKVYLTKVAAKLMQLVPITKPAGVALEKAMDLLEAKILQEYITLNGFESIARSLLPVKKVLRDNMMPAAKQYTTLVVQQTPILAQRTAEIIGKRNNVVATLYPKNPELPVVVDPHAKASQIVSKESLDGPKCNCPVPIKASGRDQVVKITQLARATFPWVNYHRKPILDALGSLVPLSKAKGFYFDHSNGYSKRVCDQLQMDKHDMGLYVIKDDAAPDKGYALWTEEPAKADRLFTIIGLAMKDKPKVIGLGTAFNQEHTQGRMTYAQAMVYNANPQIKHPVKIDMTCKRITPWVQANVGWDTLNWKPGSEQYELVGFGSGLIAKFPEIQLNWQAKLVPATATRLGDLVSEKGTLGEFEKVIQKMLPSTPNALLTH